MFPGQGAQYIGMGKDFFDRYLEAREVYQEAEDILGQNISRVCFEGPESELLKTENSQLAIFLTSMAILKVIYAQFPSLVPAVTTGLSLGEYSALVASKKLIFSEAVKLVRKRALLMNEACLREEGTMSAVIGLDYEQVLKVVSPLESEKVWIANCNSPGQIVISGVKQGIEKASLLLKESGAKKVIPLKVHGAFHSGLMEYARENLKKEIEKVSFSDSSIDIVMNATGNYLESIEHLSELMLKQVVSSVLWQQGIEAIASKGVEYFIEIGPGKVLTGLNKRILKNAQKTISIEKVSDLEFLGNEF